VRENKCKARYCAAPEDFAAKRGAAMSAPEDDGAALTALGRKYLDLWLEHWGSCLAAPETAAAMARIFTAPGGINDAAGLAGFGAMPGWPGAGHESQAFRAAPNAGDGRADELERRVAELERRLAELEPSPVMAEPARKPGGRTRKV
jgi:hypothetical protein